MNTDSKSLPKHSSESHPTFAVEEIQARLERAVTSVCPGWLVDQRDDLVQACLIRVMEISRQSEGKREFSSSYLWRVAYSALIDEIRRVRRRQEVPLEEATDVGSEPAQPKGPAGPEQGRAAREIGRGIRGCLRELVESRRRAVTLHLLGHSVPEAAALLAWDVKRTENLVYRGLADLRKCLIRKGLTP